MTDEGEKLERDKRYEQRFKSIEDVLKILVERERNFFSRGMGYATTALAVVALVISIMDKMK